MTQYVELDPTGATVVTVYACAQQNDNKPHYTTLADNDPKYLAWLAGQTANTTLNNALNAGIAIVSTATPALNGTYGVDSASQQFISGTAAGIAARNRVPGGGATFGYGDITGAPHNFAASDFLNFADAVEDYIYAIYAAARTIQAGGSATFPTASATIA